MMTAKILAKNHFRVGEREREGARERDKCTGVLGNYAIDEPLQGWERGSSSLSSA